MLSTFNATTTGLKARASYIWKSEKLKTASSTWKVSTWDYRMKHSSIRTLSDVDRDVQELPDHSRIPSDGQSAERSAVFRKKEAAAMPHGDDDDDEEEEG